MEKQQEQISLKEKKMIIFKLNIYTHEQICVVLNPRRQTQSKNWNNTKDSYFNDLQYCFHAQEEMEEKKSGEKESK